MLSVCIFALELTLLHEPADTSTSSRLVLTLRMLCRRAGSRLSKQISHRETRCLRRLRLQSQSSNMQHPPPRESQTQVRKARPPPQFSRHRTCHPGSLNPGQERATPATILTRREKMEYRRQEKKQRQERRRQRLLVTWPLGRGGGK